MVFGEPADLLRYHLEVRGLGILNVKDLFGVTAIRERKRIDLVVRLAEWSRETEYDRMGIDERRRTILDVRIPELMIPVRPGRDMASILEVAARNELLKGAGHHAAREFFDQLEGALLNERATARTTSRPPPDESATPPPVRPRPATSGGYVRGMPRAPESSASIPKPRREG
jgi:HPr kinase/phosphorylase